MYYPNLVAEMARKQIKQKDIAECIGKEEQTISKKMKGLNAFTLDEARKISDLLKTDMPIEELFLMTEEVEV